MYPFRVLSDVALIVVHPGVWMTVQDRGRTGFRRFGVPVGGASDLGSYELANGLLGNFPDDAALELTMLGGTFRAELDLAIALAGAPLAATIQGADGISRPWSIPRVGTLHAGETLILGGSAVGLRCYLAVRGGWHTPLILGSHSSEQPVRQGDRLVASPSTTSDRQPSPDLLAGFASSLIPDRPIRWVDGPDRGSICVNGSYRVLPASNRVGVRLAGGPIETLVESNRLSRPVGPGAIQLAGGQLLILGRAGGTIGGYPHVGHVIDADLDRVGQLRPGDEIDFERVKLTEARQINAEQRRSRQIWQTRLQMWAGV